MCDRTNMPHLQLEPEEQKLYWSTSYLYDWHAAPAWTWNGFVCSFEVLLVDRREVKRFSFSLAEFYWMDSFVSCRLLFSGAFFGLSSLLQMVSYAFSCKAEQGLNKYFPSSLWTRLKHPITTDRLHLESPTVCGEPFGVNTFDALILINGFVRILEMLSCFWKPA